MCPLVDLTGGGEFPVIGASYHPPGSFARHDSVVWGYAASAKRRGVDIHERRRSPASTWPTGSAGAFGRTAARSPPASS